MAECKACGHRDTQHAKFGCNQGFCKCELSNQEVIDFEKLAALRYAGEKMAKAIKPFNNVTDIESQDEEQYLYDQFQTLTRADFHNLFAALEAWEAANK